VLQKPEAGQQGFLNYQHDQFPALIDWHDPVVKHGLDHQVKYARLVQRKANSPQARGADCQGYRYYVQLALQGIPYHKPKHTVGSDTIGADLGPSTIALVPREAEANLELFCEQLGPHQEARQEATALEKQPHLRENPATICRQRAQASCPPQESAWQNGA
jgi:hypothetical protein